MNCAGNIKTIKQGKGVKMITGISLIINLEYKAEVLQEMKAI